MKKITILSIVCIVFAASAWAQRGPSRGMGMGMGPGPMGRGPGAGPMLDQQTPPADDQPQLDVKQPAPAPRFNRPQGNPQGIQGIPPVVREWLRNGGWAILRERSAQRMQMGQGPRDGMGPRQGMGRGMGIRGGMGMRGMGRQDFGPGMRGQMSNQPQLQPGQQICPRCQGQCDCPCCKAGIQGQGRMQGRGPGMGPMAGIGGMGMMRGFGGPMQDQPQDVLKFRPEIKKFDGFKDKGDKADRPEAKRDKAGKDKNDKLSKNKKNADKDKDDEGDDDEEEEEEDDDDDEKDNDR